MDTILLAQDSNLQELTKSLQQLPEVRDVTVNWSNLRGIPSIFLYVSLDDRSEWINDIFFNSRYAIFSIHNDMKLEQISKHFSLPKHRKCKIDSIKAITDKVQKWAVSAYSVTV
jgi:hypothetical protein